MTIIGLVAVPLAAAHAQQRTSGSASSAHKDTLAQVRADLHVLQTSLANEVDSRREQQDDAQYFFQATTIIVGVAALLIALAAIFATVLGYRLVRRYVEAEFNLRAKDAFEVYGQPLLQQRLDAMQDALDRKLLDIDERFAVEVALLHGNREASS